MPAAPRPTTPDAPTAPAWCAWCDLHALPCLPAHSADVVAFLAAERGRGMSLSTIDLRRAAIRYLHFIAGCVVPTVEAHVSETVAGMRREAADQGEMPDKKLAATAGILHEIIGRIGDDLAGLRDRALPGAGLAALAGSGRDRRGRAVPADLAAAHAAQG